MTHDLRASRFSKHVSVCIEESMEAEVDQDTGEEMKE
jgi:hypothetical protein